MISTRIILPGSKAWNAWKDANEISQYSLIFAEAVIVCQVNEEIGSAIIYNNPHHAINGGKCISIGKIKCSNNHTVFSELILLAKKIGKRLNATHLIGPMDGSKWQSYRCVVKSEIPPFLLDVDTELYVSELFQGAGFSILEYYHTALNVQLQPTSQLILQRRKTFEEQGLRFRFLANDSIEEELRQIHRLTEAAFAKSLLYSPISEVDFMSRMRSLLATVDGSLTTLAYNQDRLVGYLFAYIDPRPQSQNTIIAKTIARDLSKQYAGLGSVLVSHSTERGIQLGYDQMIHALMAKSNSSTMLSRQNFGKVVKEYALYTMPIA